MRVQSTVAVALLAAVVAAQNTTINPSTIDPTTRSQWCQGQYSTCGTLCSGAITLNNCDSDTLAYNCTCAANNSAPGLQYYTQTIPTFVCEQIFKNCNAANVGDAAAQALCKSNEQKNCGKLDPTNFTAQSTATTSSAATTSATSGASAASGSATSSSSKAAAATMAAMRNLGTGAFVVGVGAAFGYML